MVFGWLFGSRERCGVCGTAVTPYDMKVLLRQDAKKIGKMHVVCRKCGQKVCLNCGQKAGSELGKHAFCCPKCKCEIL